MKNINEKLYIINTDWALKFSSSMLSLWTSWNHKKSQKVLFSYNLNGYYKNCFKQVILNSFINVLWKFNHGGGMFCVNYSEIVNV